MFADITKKEFDEALYIARQKHPSAEWIKGGLNFGKMALQSEVYEFFDAITDEPPERIKAELIDVLVVGYRLYMGEWESDKTTGE